MENACYSPLFQSENVSSLVNSPPLSDIQDISEIDIQDIGQIDKLISCIEGRLKAIEDNSPTQIPDKFQPTIKFGNDLLENVLKSVNRRACKNFETSVLLQQGIERYEYNVKFLPHPQAKQLVLKIALESTDQLFPENVDIDGLVEMCSGIPLILELVGYKLREDVNDVSTFKDLVTSVKESLAEGKEDICEGVVDVVYDSLKETRLKEAFLDIACFFNNWPWRIVSYAIGRNDLKALERAGLVRVCRKLDLQQNTPDRPKWNELQEFVKYVDYQTGTVKVVDAIRAQGKKLSNSDRIMDDVESFSRALHITQKIKGILLSSTDEYEFKAKRFASIASSLKILHFGPAVHVKTVCKGNFENLRYLRGNALPVDVK